MRHCLNITENRANALASLLNNKDMLEDVYDQATNNYQGSAQNELNTYLDSIEAKQLRSKNLGHSYGNQKVLLILLKDCLILATVL